MLNIFRKSNGSRQDSGGGKDSGFEPPKNLPDLAGDIYEKYDNVGQTSLDVSSTVSSGDESKKSSVNGITPAKSTLPETNARVTLKTDTPIPASSGMPASSGGYGFGLTSNLASSSDSSKNSYSRPILEPSKESVPSLDVSLVKQQSVPLSRPDVHSLLQSSQQRVSRLDVQPTLQSTPYSTSYSDSQQYSHPSNISRPNMSMPISQSRQLDDDFLLSQENSAVLDNFTGFFKEFENHIRDKGLNNDVIDALLDKNLLDHMVFYHTAKGGDMPFYASSAELSHAIKLKLESLQSIEHAWVLNKQKIDLLKKLGVNMESDIHIMSEELKRLLAESRKRGNVVRPNDFFQIVRPRDENATYDEHVHGSYTNAVPSSYNNTGPSSYNNISNTNISSSSTNTNGRLAYRFPLKNYLIADPSKYFYASNGQVFKSLGELIDGLESMDKTSFEHHVNYFKNDFANWIKGVFADVRLADAIRPISNREQLWHFFKSNTEV